MSKTTVFWYAVVVALAVFARQSVSLPLETINAPPANDKVNTDEQKLPELSTESESTDAQQEGTDVQPLVQQQKTEQIELAPAGSELPATVGTEFPATGNAATSDVPYTPTLNTESNPEGSARPNDKASGPAIPSIVVAAVPDGNDDDAEDQPKKPQFMGAVHTLKINPFLMDFFQPLQVFQPFQPFQPFNANPNYAPQQPFGAPMNPFDPFANPMRSPSFNQLVTAYTNEFRNMLEALDKSMVQIDSPANTQNVKTNSDGKPLAKTTTKTEVIDGHVVQTNETTYTDGGPNHKSYFHFKQIQVVPEDKKQTVANEKVISTSNYDSEVDKLKVFETPSYNVESEKMETNEIKRDPSENMVIANAVADDNPNFIKKSSGPVPLEDHFQTSAATYYAPNAPYHHSPPAALLYYNRPPPATLSYYGAPLPMVANYRHPPIPPMAENYGQPPIPPMAENYGRPSPISLHGDTYVNELAAAQHHVTGSNAVLPPDVEFVDLHGKPQQGSQSYNAGHKKYYGEKKMLH